MPTVVAVTSTPHPVCLVAAYGAASAVIHGPALVELPVLGGES